MSRRAALLVGCLMVAACSADDEVEPPVTTIATPPGSTVPATSTTTTTTTITTGTTSNSPTTTTSTTTTTTTSTTTTTTLPPVILPPATLPTTSLPPTTLPPTTLPPVTLPPTTGPPPTDPPATSAVPAPGSTGSIRDVRPASDIPPPPVPDDWVVESIGASVQGRDIVSWSRRLESPRLRIVVVGAVHGNEPASPPTVRALVEVAYPDDVEVWLVPELNPDGVAAGTRWNANGVDLNRNFPWGWRADDGGPAALSEPEAAAIADLIVRLDPDAVVWVHQPYGYVSSIGGTPDAFEQAWSAGSGLPVRADVTQHGGGESWTAFDAGRPSMLIEIDTWAATPEIVAAQRAGFERLLGTLADTGG